MPLGEHMLCKALGNWLPDAPCLLTREKVYSRSDVERLAAKRADTFSEAGARAADLAARLGLAGRLDEPVRRWSHGMRKKLSFACAVLHRPPVVLCDEALESFDAAAALAAKDELRARARAGAAVLFSSHVTETMERLCDRVVLLHLGRVVGVVPRAAWGRPDDGPSPLEREFLSLLRSPTGGPAA